MFTYILGVGSLIWVSSNQVQLFLEENKHHGHTLKLIFLYWSLKKSF